MTEWASRLVAFLRDLVRAIADGARAGWRELTAFWWRTLWLEIAGLACLVHASWVWVHTGTAAMGVALFVAAWLIDTQE